MANLAAVRIRGSVDVDFDIKKGLEILKLLNQHVCVIMPDTPSNRGKLTKVKDYVTYGEVSEDTIKELVEKRGQKATSDTKFFEYHGKKVKPFFRLSPPRKGFERKGIKTPFGMGGALGYRGDDINDLLRRMI